MKTQSAVPALQRDKARHVRLIGIALMCGAVGTFSCFDTTAKYLGRHIDIMQVVWARYTFALWVIALGYAVFGDRPDAYTLVVHRS